MKIKVIYIFLTILFVLVSSIHGLSTFKQQDLTERRDNYVINIVNGGPDLQFYMRADENITDFRYTLHWNELIEFSDSNANGLYDPNEDTRVDSVNISSLVFDGTYGWINVTDADGINHIRAGKRFNFTTSFSQGSGEATLTVAIDWFENDTSLNYAGNFLNITKSESKYSIDLKNWQFSSSDNMLALTTTILTTTPLEKYATVSYDNGTFGMLTKEKADGKVYKGGIFNNPLVVEVDNNVGNVKTSAVNNGETIDLQYSFPSFSDSLHYDPTYAAVAVVSLPEEFQQTDTSGNEGLPGFQMQVIALTFIGIILISKLRTKIR